MAKSFRLTIARIGENLFDGEATSVTLPGAEGQFTVLADHEAFVSPLGPGVALVKAADGTETSYAVENGVCEVSSGQATVLL
jgi:F-type H+-transporting ATPase subunit epsilon